MGTSVVQAFGASSQCSNDVMVLHHIVMTHMAGLQAVDGCLIGHIFKMQCGVHVTDTSVTHRNRSASACRHTYSMVICNNPTQDTWMTRALW